jgi:putative oxygen-independent coproporphyrinogen III oxidase
MVITLSDPNEFSLYFHIPFCKRKCDYCNFYVIPDKEQHKTLLLESLKIEWNESLKKIPPTATLASIYFGGGTPSLFGPDRIDQIINWIKQSFSIDVEITLEVNPEDVTRTLIVDYKQAGINRISMGVQSLDDRELQLLTRRHNVHKALAAIDDTYNAGISNISIDLMYDLPHQTTTGWQKTVQTAARLPITHLSLYNLTIEPHTVFYKYKNQLSQSIPDEESSFAMYTHAIDTLESAGLAQYEISAFAREGLHSRHNTGYWTGRSFLGLGPSAYSFWDGLRYKNVANINKYAQALQSVQSPVDTVDELSTEDRKKELLVVALRLLDGVNILQFEELHGPLSKDTNKTLRELTEQGLLEMGNHHVKLTRRGILLYDSIASELI